MGIETAMFDYYPLSPLLRGDFEEVFLPLDVPDMVQGKGGPQLLLL